METKQSNSRGCSVYLPSRQDPGSRRPGVSACRSNAKEEAGTGTTAGSAGAENSAWMEAMLLVHRWETIFGKGAVQRVSSSWL